MATETLKDDRDVAEWARKFKRERKQKKTYVLYFTSSGCGGCIEYEPHWQQFVTQALREMKNVAIIIVKDYAMYPLAEKLHFHLRYTPTILFMSPTGQRFKWKLVQERAVADLLQRLRNNTTQQQQDERGGGGGGGEGKGGGIKDGEGDKTATSTALMYYYHPAHIKDPANYANLTALAALKENAYDIRIEKSNDWTEHMTLIVNRETTYRGHAASIILSSLVRALCL